MGLREETAFIKSLKWDGGLLPEKRVARPTYQEAAQSLRASREFSFYRSTWVGLSSPQALFRSARDYAPQHVQSAESSRTLLNAIPDSLTKEEVIYTLLLRLGRACEQYGPYLEESGYSMSIVATARQVQMDIMYRTGEQTTFHYSYDPSTPMAISVTHRNGGLGSEVAESIASLLQREEGTRCSSVVCTSCSLNQIGSLAMVSSILRYVRASNMLHESQALTINQGG